MIAKLLVLIVVIAVVYFVFFKKKSKKKDNTEVEQMVECEECGTYISPNEGIIKSGKYYCSKECAGVK